MKNLDFSTYLSPFSWRYGSLQMREIWSEINKRKLWRKMWVELARAQHKMGIVSKKELDDIISHQNNIDIERAHEIEKEIYHDVMAEIKTYAEQCKVGGGKIHCGATSTDIIDNAEILQIKQALELTKKRLIELLKNFCGKIEKYHNKICMGYTHLQPAEPTTLGYRLSLYAQDLFWDLKYIEKIEEFIKGKGIKGAVGTAASYDRLLKNTKYTAFDLEQEIMDSLKLEAVDVSSQTYPRKIDWFVMVALCNIAQSLHKFNFDLRLMQSPNFGEWSEPRNAKRVGSSAMPFKKNPDKAEKVCSLARYVSSLLNVSWSNGALSLLERTLDDSANRRVFFPEGFLAIDECLITTNNLVKDLMIFDNVIEKNLEKYGIFSATESLMMEMVKKGANRQETHELIRELSLSAWSEIQEGKSNPLKDLLINNHDIKKYLKKEEIEKLLDTRSHIGNASQRSLHLAKTIKNFRRLADKKL
ncbi:MAG: adenylosuccinate lyase [Candidatus Roizmanbacteria bacterium]|nr:MAG: adenylosuccinate lyase [Candidatus Roizmanbacteria bacterium]